MSKWFLCQNEEVEGPLNVAQLSERIEASTMPTPLWYGGLAKSEWQPAPQWLQHIQQQKLQGHP